MKQTNTETNARRRNNKNARLEERGAGRNRRIITAHRDGGSLVAQARFRRRNDVATGRSLTNFEIVSEDGQCLLTFSGRAARTLYRVLDRAIHG